MTHVRLAWAAWLTYAAAWTFALLSPWSLSVRDAVIAEDYAFSVGKSLHVAAYAVFTIMSSLPPPRRMLLLVVLIHAPLVEWLQQFTGRTTLLSDVCYDLVGVALGVALTWKRLLPQGK